MPNDIIITPGERVPVDVDTSLDNMGRGNAEPIDGHRVVLTIPESEMKKD